MPEGSRNNALLYTKTAVAALVLTYLLAFMIINSRNEATVWVVPFQGDWQMPTLLVIVITALLSTVGWWLVMQIYRTWKKRSQE